MNQKNALAKALRALAAAIENLEDDQIDQLLSGKGKLAVVAAERPRSGGAPSFVEYGSILQKLNNCKSRDEARQVLGALASREALVAFARSQKVHVVKHDRREDVEDKIVEFIIGGKLRTEAIQTLNLRAGGGPQQTMAMPDASQYEVQSTYETAILRFLELHPEQHVVGSTFKNEDVPGLETLSVEEIRTLLKKLAAEDRIDQVLDMGVTMYRHKKKVGGGRRGTAS